MSEISSSVNLNWLAKTSSFADECFKTFHQDCNLLENFAASDFFIVCILVNVSVKTQSRNDFKLSKNHISWSMWNTVITQEFFCLSIDFCKVIELVLISWKYFWIVISWTSINQYDFFKASAAASISLSASLIDSLKRLRSWEETDVWSSRARLCFFIVLIQLTLNKNVRHCFKIQLMWCIQISWNVVRFVAKRLARIILHKLSCDTIWCEKVRRRYDMRLHEMNKFNLWHFYFIDKDSQSVTFLLDHESYFFAYTMHAIDFCCFLYCFVAEYQSLINDL